MKKRLLSTLLAVCMLFSILPANFTLTPAAAGLPLRGYGAETEPYLIRGSEDFETFREMITGAGWGERPEYQNPVVINCYNGGTVTTTDDRPADDSSAWAGGIVSWISDGSIIQRFNTGTVTDVKAGA